MNSHRTVRLSAAVRAERIISATEYNINCINFTPATVQAGELVNIGAAVSPGSCTQVLFEF